MTPIADPATQAAAALKMALRAVLLSGQAPTTKAWSAPRRNTPAIRRSRSRTAPILAAVLVLACCEPPKPQALAHGPRGQAFGPRD